MRIVFGLSDGPVWPDPCRGGAPCPGTVFTGPLGFLAALEERLGLPGKTTPGGARIAGYVNALAAFLDAEGPDREKVFYCESFSRDKWGTGKRMLAMRDELKFHGILDAPEYAPAPGGGGVPDRMAVFRAVEALSAGNAASAGGGTADRLRLVRTAIETDGIFGLDEVRLAAPLELYAVPWRELVQILRDRGVAVTEFPPREGAPSTPKTVWRLRTRTPAEAADLLAALYAVQKKERRMDMPLIRKDPCDELDAALARHGLSAWSGGARTTARACEQILPLFFRYRFLPFSPETLRSILLLPVSPVRPIAGAVLERLMEAEARPVFDSKALRLPKGVSPQEAEAMHTRWLAIAEPTPQGIPAGRMLELARDLAEWAGEQAGGEWKAIHWLERLDFSKNDPDQPSAARAKLLLEKHGTLLRALSMTRDACLAMAATVDAYARSSGTMVDAGTMEKLLEAALGAGTGPGAAGEPDFPVLDDPSRLRGPVPMAVWWDFTRPGDLVRDTCTWKRESARWPQLGMISRIMRAAGEWGWTRPFELADTVLVVVPECKNGEQAFPHPQLDRLDGAPDRFHVADITPEDLFNPESPFLKACGLAPLVRPSREHGGRGSRAPAPRPAADVRNRTLYATSLELLLQCPFRWHLERGLRLGQDGTALCSDAIVEGNLVHAVLEECLGNAERGTIPAAEVLALLKDKAAVLGARYLEPARLPGLIPMAAKIAAALGQLRAYMEERDLCLYGCEQTSTADCDLPQLKERGLRIGGKYDIALARRSSPDRIAAIVDIKWCGRARSEEFENSLREGSLQLETYRRLAEKNNLADPEGITICYLLPKQGRLAGDSSASGGQGPSSSDRWSQTETRLAEVLADMEAGATGVAGDEDADAVCRYCGFADFCGMESPGGAPDGSEGAEDNGQA